MATKEIEKNANSDEGRRLLLFDNQSFVVKSLVLNLRLLGWDVTFVSSINDLFLELNQSLYNIIILDVMSPIPSSECKHVFSESDLDDMSNGLTTGVVLAKEIWKMEQYKDTPILFLSGREFPRSSSKLLEKINCDYMRKPQLAINVDQKLSEMLK